MLVEVFYKLLETLLVWQLNRFACRDKCVKCLDSEAKRIITWLTDAEVAEVKNPFYQRGGFPCVIGCVDGTHIRIQAPNEHENAYVNRKGFHSINVQEVCNHEGQY